MTERKSSFAALASSALAPEEKLAPVRNADKTFFIGLPKEIALQEKRISLTPDAVSLLVNHGHKVFVETHAGEGSKFTDQMFSEAGASIVPSPREVYQADIILKIEPPTLPEIELMKAGQILISALQLGNLEEQFIAQLNRKKVTALAYEFIEDKVGGMPVIRALSEIAGIAAVSVAAQYLSTAEAGRGIILGGITGVPPTKMVILGAGTVAESVARAAISLGVEIQIFDNHLYKLRRIKHILGQQVYTSTIDTNGLAETLRTADVLVGTLRAEKGQTRHVVSDEMVRQMKPDSLIIDLSIDQGGCIATSEITTHLSPVFRKYDVIHYCVPNIAARVARTATNALSNIFTPLLIRAAAEGGMEEMTFNNKGFQRGIYTYKGHLTNEAIARKLGINHRNIELLLAARI
jgi:alanine dehydrogenase